MNPETNMGRSVSKLYDSALFLFRLFIDFVYPPFCLTCKKPLPDSTELICPACWQSQERLDQPFLPANRLAAVPMAKLHLDGAAAAFTYSEITQELIHLFKYRKYEKLSEPFSKELCRVIKENGLNRFDCIVPVPLHKKRKKERGFNQAELMAAIVSDYFAIEKLDALLRTRYTQPQAKMNRRGRAANVSGAFAVKDVRVEDRRIILVDDVMTTGSTLNECARLLKEAGAASVMALTIARA